jgi:hypothetical protein
VLGESEGRREGDTTDFRRGFPRDGRTESGEQYLGGYLASLTTTPFNAPPAGKPPVRDSYSFCVKELLMLLTAFPPEIACR